MPCNKRLLPYLDDDQAELTLQQKQEALADAIGRVSSLQLRKDRFSLEFGTISSMTRVCVCVSNLLYQLDHADAVSLVEGDGAA